MEKGTYFQHVDDRATQGNVSSFAPSESEKIAFLQRQVAEMQKQQERDRYERRIQELEKELNEIKLLLQERTTSLAGIEQQNEAENQRLRGLLSEKDDAIEALKSQVKLKQYFDKIAPVLLDKFLSSPSGANLMNSLGGLIGGIVGGEEEAQQEPQTQE